MKQLLKYILSQTLEHQKIAETKHGVGIALTSGFAVIVINFVGSENAFIKSSSIISLVFCILSLAMSFMAVGSKLIKVKEKLKEKEIVNYIYFNDIKNFSPLQYLDELSIAYDFPKGYIPDSFEIDLAKTIISISQRTAAKYKLFNISIALLFASIILLFVFCLVGGIYGIQL